MKMQARTNAFKLNLETLYGERAAFWRAQKKRRMMRTHFAFVHVSHMNCIYIQV